MVVINIKSSSYLNLTDQSFIIREETILYGSNIMDFNKQKKEKLQKIENSVDRQIMGPPRYTQESALREDIGMCSMRAS